MNNKYLYSIAFSLMVAALVVAIILKNKFQLFQPTNGVSIWGLEENVDLSYSVFENKEEGLFWVDLKNGKPNFLVDRENHVVYLPPIPEMQIEHFLIHKRSKGFGVRLNDGVKVEGGWFEFRGNQVQLFFTHASSDTLMLKW